MERNTHQKKVIMDTLPTLAGQHPTADMVYALVKPQIPAISRATVYRVLGQIAGQGVVRRIQVPGAADRYDDRLEQHYHMRCQCCGAVVDVEMPALDLRDRLPEGIRDRVTGYDILFSGFCANCAGNTM